MAVKNSQRFAEIERLMGDYFGCHLAPVMGRVQRDLSNRQADEMRAYSNSTAGILRSLATANMPGDDPYATLKITGKWNSKTTEDYLAMCKEAIVGNKDMQRDLAVMAEEWRKAVVTEIGRERYDALSKQLGCDLAYAYIDHRMEQLMIEKMVKDRMPTSSADYIIRKAAQSSLFGLPYELNKSPLAAEIEAKGEAAYKPSRTEKAAGWAAGAGADVVAMGGIGSWATFAKFVGIDMVMNVGMEHLSKKGSSQEVSVEECISKGVLERTPTSSPHSASRQRSSRTTRTAISRLPTAISRTRFPRAISLLWIGRNKPSRPPSHGIKVRSLILREAKLPNVQASTRMYP